MTTPGHATNDVQRMASMRSFYKLAKSLKCLIETGSSPFASLPDSQTTSGCVHGWYLAAARFPISMLCYSTQLRWIDRARTVDAASQAVCGFATGLLFRGGAACCKTYDKSETTGASKLHRATIKSSSGSCSKQRRFTA